MPLTITFTPISLCLSPSLRQRDGGVGPIRSLNRILIHPSELPTSQTLHLPPDDSRARHIHQVLHIPCTGGHIRAAIIDQCLIDHAPVQPTSDYGALIHLADGSRRSPPPTPPVSLILAVPRPKVLARLIPHIAAVGVSSVALVNAYKVERCYFDAKLLLNSAEVESLLIDGVSQAGVDCRLPRVLIEKQLKVFLEDRLEEFARGNVVRVVAEPGAERTVLETLLRKVKEGGGERHVVVAVGPEGGWTRREVEMLERFGFERVGLGQRVLRTDAAVLVLLGLVHEALRYAGDNL